MVEKPTHLRAYLYGLTLGELRELVVGWGEPSFRANQIWRWLYGRLATSPADMTDLPLALRERMSEEAEVGQLAPMAVQRSADGEAEKWVLQLPDGETIETVLLSYERRETLCISSQVGCAMGCVFCATGQMGFRRHLTAGEIVEQVIIFERELQRRGEPRSKGKGLTNIVFMGMGEPLHNYSCTMEAVRRLIDPAGFGFGARRITVSTVGLAPQIRRLAGERLKVGLAISLHAATDEERERLVPAARRWPLAELVAASRYYAEQTGRRVTFEWALIQDENDSPEQARALVRLLQGMPCHVNLIPLNPTAVYSGQRSSPPRIKRFQEILASQGLSTTVRVRRGTDIQAGCGQLRQRITESGRSLDL